MRFQRRSSRLLRTALVAALSALFFLLAMGITLMGSSVYRSTAAASDAHYTARTAVSYLANQLRQGDRTGSVTASGEDASGSVSYAPRCGVSVLEEVDA